MGYRDNITLCAGHGQWLPARTFVSGPYAGWIGRRTVSVHRPAPLHPAGRLERPAGRTLDHPHRSPPEEVGVSWYTLHFWIQLGFNAVRSLGWKWDKARRTDPARISRHWLVLSLATLQVLAYDSGCRRRS